MSKRLVIDTSIMQSAGNAADPTSENCREFLIRVREICHRLVLTDDIMNEWKRHRSNFSREWIRSMMRTKHKCSALRPAHDKGVRDKILDKRISGPHREIMEDDMHLIEAALDADNIGLPG